MARVLIIEDDELVSHTIRQVMEKAGHEVSVACNGNEGLKLFREHGADLVITDIIMPEKEGIETTIELRKEDPDVMIIAISGGGRTGNTLMLKVAETLGANRVLAKPFSRQELELVVRQCIG